MGSSMLGSSLNPGSSGLDTSQMSIAEQLMQLDQAITLTLQDIDANLSAAHQTVNNKILPAVKRYGVASARTWQGAKFWMKFFEAAADVNLSGNTPGYGVGQEEDEGLTEEGGEYYDDDDDDLKTIDATVTDRPQDQTQDVTGSSMADDGDDDILEEQQHHNLQRYSLMGTTSAAASSSKAKGQGPSLPSPSPSPLPPATSHDDSLDADDSDDLDDSVDITRLRPVASYSRYVSTPSTDNSVGVPPSITQARSIEDDTFFGIRPPTSSKSASGGARSGNNSTSSGTASKDYGSGPIQNPFAKPPSGGPKPGGGAARAGQPTYKAVENTVHGGRSLIGTDRSDTFSPPSPSPFGPSGGSSS
ncbi:DASH complex subunit ask1 [Tilletia horrida]|uniref:DASH complex subunit ASK1 n=1 Tax=Tilletia horrida TaxID=155126 RepID=A0AAN6GP69_9BASI|nr:DASH complex subunit ask1 [Tilletia horrida]KAK0549718.1 DASH complex subunit ask1 [Tilletia horrida]